MPSLAGDHLVFEAGLSVSLQRTLRVPPSDEASPLPPGFGPLPLRVFSGASRCLREVGASDATRVSAYLAPLRQGEAVWLAFHARHWRPVALQVGLGEVNAVSGGPWSVGLEGQPQNYVTCPDQPWLDGINVGAGTIRQFVAIPLGSGRTVEGQVSGVESSGGLRLRVFPPLPGCFPDTPPETGSRGRRETPAASPAVPEMGLAAGGRMRQRIHPDRHGVQVWDRAHPEEAVVHLLNTMQYRNVTGEKAPPTPISAAEYARLGLPWFDLYDEGLGTLDEPDSFRSVVPLDEDRKY